MNEFDCQNLEISQAASLRGICCENHVTLGDRPSDSKASELILASNSPRRRELLTQAGYHFQVDISDIDEKSIFSQSLAENFELRAEEQVALACRAVAEAKAKSVWQNHHHDDALVLSADTIVYDGKTVLGKPRDDEDAFSMLRSLSGKAHQVMTAVAMIADGKLESFVSVTLVHFYPWDKAQEAAALASIRSGSALDKAGAYGIQEGASLLVEKIEGDYNTVVGLPLAEVYRRLAAKGIW